MYVSVLEGGLGGALGVDGGWLPLPTRPQRYCDPASLVLFIPVIKSFVHLRLLMSSDSSFKLGSSFMTLHFKNLVVPPWKKDVEEFSSLRQLMASILCTLIDYLILLFCYV